MTTTTTTTTTLTFLDGRSAADLPPLGDCGFVIARGFLNADQVRAEWGDAAQNEGLAWLADTDDGFDSWEAAATAAFKLSKGRRKALVDALSKVQGWRYRNEESPMGYAPDHWQCRVNSRGKYQGEGSALIHGYKSLLDDGLLRGSVTATYEHYKSTTGDYNGSRVYLHGMSPRAEQMAWCLRIMHKPIGSIPQGVDPEVVWSKLNAAAREMLIAMGRGVLRAPSSTRQFRRGRIEGVTRAQSGAIRALENRGFIRVTDRKKVDDGCGSTFVELTYRVPRGSQLVRFAARYDMDCANALLLAHED